MSRNGRQEGTMEEEKIKRMFKRMNILRWKDRRKLEGEEYGYNCFCTIKVE